MLDTLEQFIYMVVAVVGALLWGYVIGTWVAVLGSMDPAQKWFHKTMDQLNTFMHACAYEAQPCPCLIHAHGFTRTLSAALTPSAPPPLPSDHLHGDMRVRLREFFQQACHVHQGHMRRDLLMLMSPMLHGQVALAISGAWLRKVHFLKGVEQEMLILVATNLRPAVFAPGELVTPGFFYVSHKGTALYGARVLPSGKEWGADCILRDVSLQHAPARAMSYLEVYRLSRREIIEVAKPFPIGCAKLRWAAIRLAFIRYILKSSPKHWQARGHGVAAGGNGLLKGGFDGAFAKASSAMSSTTQHARTWSRRVARGSAEDKEEEEEGGAALNLTKEDEAPTLGELARGLDLVSERVGHLDTSISERVSRLDAKMEGIAHSVTAILVAVGRGGRMAAVERTPSAEGIDEVGASQGPAVGVSCDAGGRIRLTEPWLDALPTHSFAQTPSFAESCGCVAHASSAASPGHRAPRTSPLAATPGSSTR